jgi:hypothetical protein
MYDSKFKNSTSNYVQNPMINRINLEKTVPKGHPMATEYPTILPTEYYKNIIDK